MLKIGTRKSPLALVQTKMVADKLPGADIIPMSTKGDEWLDAPLTEVGGKGLFTKELDDALLRGEIDLAVHSMKDMPTVLPEGITIGAVLQREDVRDVWVGTAISQLKPGATVGTSSLRRSIQVLKIRPDVKITSIRGNVQTRINKVGNEVDATVLALAGLKRLGLDVGEIMELEDMLPAVGQGAIAVVCRAGDSRVLDALKPLHHQPTSVCVTAERAMLKALDGSCRTPIAGHATLTNDVLTLTGLSANPDGSNFKKSAISGPSSEAEGLGISLAKQLKP